MNRYIGLIAAVSFLGASYALGVQVDVYNTSKDPIWISFVNNGEDRVLRQTAANEYASFMKAGYRIKSPGSESYVIKVDPKAKQRIKLDEPVRLRMLLWKTNPGPRWQDNPGTSYFRAKPFPNRVYQFEVLEGKNVLVDWNGKALNIHGKDDIFLNPRDIFRKNIKGSDIRELYLGETSVAPGQQPYGNL